MRLVEDVDLVPALRWLEHDALADLADVVDAALRRRIHLDDVEGRAPGDGDARIANLVRLRRRPLPAVEALREDSRHRGLPGPARSGEEICLANLLPGDRVLQGPHDRFLADHLVEVLRPVLAVERRHRSDSTRVGSGCASGPGSGVDHRYARVSARA